MREIGFMRVVGVTPVEQAHGMRLTDLCVSLHLEDLDTFNNGGARVVNAVDHGLWAHSVLAAKERASKRVYRP